MNELDSSSERYTYRSKRYPQRYGDRTLDVMNDRPRSMLRTWRAMLRMHVSVISTFDAEKP